MIRKIIRYAAVGGCVLALGACSSYENKTLTQESADSLASQLEASNSFVISAFRGSSDLLDADVSQLAQNAALSTLGLAPLASSCNVKDSQNTVDADGDGIPVSARYEIDCRYTSDSDNSSVSVRGATRTQDKDDNDKRSGYTVQTDTYTIKITDAEGRSYSTSLDLDVDITVAATGYSAALNFEFEAANPDERGRVAYTYDASYIPTNVSDPFAGGTFSYDGSLTFDNDRERYALMANVDDLRYNEDCTSSFTGGSATYTDTAGSSLDITYNSCGNYSKSFQSGS